MREQYEQAVALHRQGKLAEAERLYRAVHAAYPKHPGALHGIGSICLRTARIADAQAMLARAAELAPQDAAIRGDLGQAYLMLGRFEEAAACFQRVSRMQPANVRALMGLGDAWSVLGQVDAARAAFEKLRTVEPKHAGAHFGLGNLAMQQGHFAEARRAFEQAIALAPREPAYHRALGECERFSDGDPRLVTLEALARENLTDAQKVELHFALAKAYDDLRRYDDAFAQLVQGHAIKRRSAPYDEASVAAFFREIAAAFAPALLQGRSGAGNPSEVPVFVVGMPRSGTTLVEQILASHPSVHGAGELLVMNDLIGEGFAGADYPNGVASLKDDTLAAFGRNYVARVRRLAPDAARIVDKLPANCRHLGLIHLALPKARIIHVRRDPMDTCFSCYSKLFLNGLNYTHDLGELGRYHKMYDGLMAHWCAALPPGAMLEVQYETLAENLETEARRIVAYCSLDWDARCLDFHKTERAIRTQSLAQVRQPVFTSSIGRWRAYEPWLEPLRQALR